MASATFPRTILPATTTPMSVPTGLVSVGHTGKAQLRSVVAMGRSWSETWGALRAGDADVEGFLAWIEWAYNNSMIFTITHLSTPGSGLPPRGVSGGTPLILGAGQTGALIHSDGWDPSVANILRAGDVIRIAGVSPLLRITDNADSNGVGQVDFRITPSIPVGSSPADNAVISHEFGGLTLNAYIAAPPDLPNIQPGYIYVGMSLSFREAV